MKLLETAPSAPHPSTPESCTFSPHVGLALAERRRSRRPLVFRISGAFAGGQCNHGQREENAACKHPRRVPRRAHGQIGRSGLPSEPSRTTPARAPHSHGVRDYAHRPQPRPRRGQGSHCAQTRSSSPRSETSPACRSREADPRAPGRAASADPTAARRSTAAQKLTGTGANSTATFKSASSAPQTITAPTHYRVDVLRRSQPPPRT